MNDSESEKRIHSIKRLKEVLSPRNKAEAIFDLSDTLARIDQGLITCSEEIKNSVKGLIKDLCTELIEELR